MKSKWALMLIFLNLIVLILLKFKNPQKFNDLYFYFLIIVSKFDLNFDIEKNQKFSYFPKKINILLTLFE